MSSKVRRFKRIAPPIPLRDILDVAEDVDGTVYLLARGDLLFARTTTGWSLVNDVPCHSFELAHGPGRLVVECDTTTPDSDLYERVGGTWESRGRIKPFQGVRVGPTGTLHRAPITTPEVWNPSRGRWKALPVQAMSRSLLPSDLYASGGQPDPTTEAFAARTPSLPAGLTASQPFLAPTGELFVKTEDALGDQAIYRHDGTRWEVYLGSAHGQGVQFGGGANCDRFSCGRGVDVLRRLRRLPLRRHRFQCGATRQPHLRLGER